MAQLPVSPAVLPGQTDLGPAPRCRQGESLALEELPLPHSVSEPGLMGGGTEEGSLLYDYGYDYDDNCCYYYYC